MVGCETADFLGEHHHDVTVVEMTDMMARDIAQQCYPMLMARLRDYNVKLMPSTKVLSFTENGAKVDSNGNETELSGFDTIVLALGCRSPTPIYEELNGKVSQLFA